MTTIVEHGGAGLPSPAGGPSAEELTALEPVPELFIRGPVFNGLRISLDNSGPFGREKPILAAYLEANERGEGAVAAGLLLRFGEPVSLKAIVSGHADPTDIVDRWWASLSESQQAGLCAWTLGLASQLGHRAETLAEDQLPEEPGWQAELVAILHGRDELASASATLRRHRPEAVPRGYTVALDAALLEVLDLAYVQLELGAYLEAVGQRSSAHWWARPGRHREQR